MRIPLGHRDGVHPLEGGVRLLMRFAARYSEPRPSGLVDLLCLEAAYKHVPSGRPPIHPRRLASVILYGLLVKIRASRKLEAALAERIDFKWLAEGSTIDHATLCEFRVRHAAALAELFVKVSLVAQPALLLRARVARIR